MSETSRHIQNYSFECDGLYVQHWNYDHEKDRGWSTTEKITEPKEILAAFNRSCEIGQDVKLLDILTTLEPIKQILELIMLLDFDAVINDYNTNISKAVLPDRGQYLEVYCSCGIEGFIDDKDKMKHDFEFSISFHEVVPGEDFPYAIDLAPIYEYILFPVVLNKNVKIYLYQVNGTKNNTNITNTNINVPEAKHYFTTYEIIKAILWEIGFVGSPEDKQQLREQIDQSMKEIEEQT